jgi:fibro-slime domain-containing protein
MRSAWIPSLMLVPLAVALGLTGCGAAGKTPSRDLGPGDQMSGSETGGSSGSLPGNGTGGSSPPIIMMDGGAVDPCAEAGEPEGCMTHTVPACGDGMLNQDDEVCDDGNTLPGDCCSGSCKLEPNCVCDDMGANCHSTIVCGDGMRGPGEACDDGNTTPDDGCSPDCHNIGIGYSCPTPGMPCIRHFVCGDGIVDPNEGCDDQNNMPGDGCSEHCRIEQGFKCDGNPSKCSMTTCGDGKKEGAESCDDGNRVAFDGCSPDCRAEPTCATGKACTSSCGDGIVFGDEECDDGNVRDGDGCSSNCRVEEGYLCDNDAPCTTQMGVDPVSGETKDICTLTIPAVFRDFNAANQTGGHPDFQPGYNSNGAVQGIVQDTLDADGKPVQVANLPTATMSNAFLHGQAAFAQWYRDAKPSSGPIPGQLVLWDNGKGGYVNRWGKNGEQWQGQLMSADYQPITYGGPAGGGCQACNVSATGMCYDPCTPWSSLDQTATRYACCAEIPTDGKFDGNPLFFPIDTAKGILTEPRSQGGVPEQYGWPGWPDETTVATTLGIRTAIQTSTAPFPSTTHNFSFTTEVKYWFRYTKDLKATLDFTGDDDLWVFLNGHLAVDMGGWHVPLNGTLTINGATVNAAAQTDKLGTGPAIPKNGNANGYGLTDGSVYQIQIFNAEREVKGSSFRLTLAGFNMTPSNCVTNCGDGMVGPGEECDDGVNKGGYNECAPGCIYGPRCGDGVPQTDFGEVCDEGETGNVGAYGGCGADCQPGPRCGDAVVQTDAGEVCDDGMNLGEYGGCAPNCQPGPHCGDNVIDVPYEACDDGNTVNHDGCSNCKVDIVTR